MKNINFADLNEVMEPSSSKPTESLLTQFAKSLGLFPFDLEGQSFPLTIGQSILEFINNGKTTADNFILGYFLHFIYFIEYCLMFQFLFSSH